MANKKGKLIVIEGGDGSGKTTQAKLLMDYLAKKNIPTKYMDFPQYYKTFYGETVARFLRGEFGNIDQVSPYLISLVYSLDRLSAKEEMDGFIGRGGVIVSNRYTPSNMAHQGGKFITDKEREDYLRWVYKLEYEIHKIPREDIVIYLYVPWQIGMKLTENKNPRTYLKGKDQDIHEKDVNHRKMTEKMYLELAKRYKNWVKIDCVQDGKILPPDVIHEKIIKLLKERGLT